MGYDAGISRFKEVYNPNNYALYRDISWDKLIDNKSDYISYCGWCMNNSDFECAIEDRSNYFDSDRSIGVISRVGLKDLIKEYKNFYKTFNKIYRKYSKFEDLYDKKLDEAGFTDVDIRTFYFLYDLKKFLTKHNDKYFVFWRSW